MIAELAYDVPFLGRVRRPEMSPRESTPNLTDANRTTTHFDCLLGHHAGMLDREDARTAG